MEDYTWIKLHRKLLDNPVMKNPNLLQLFIYCLLKANHKENEFIFGGSLVKVERGSFITGRFEIAKALNMNPSSVYKNLKKLQLLGYISLNSNNKNTMLSVMKYNTYQTTVTTKEQQSNNKVTTKEQQSNTNKNDKKEKNDNNEKKKDLQEKAPAKSIITEMRLIFEDWYFSKKQTVYYYNGKDAKNLTQIKGKILFLLTEDKKTDLYVLNTFRHLLLKLDDEWILNNLDIPIINSKFNQIINQIKNGKQPTTNKKQFDPDQLIRDYADLKESQRTKQ